MLIEPILFSTIVRIGQKFNHPYFLVVNGLVSQLPFVAIHNQINEITNSTFLIKDTSRKASLHLIIVYAQASERGSKQLC